MWPPVFFIIRAREIFGLFAGSPEIAIRQRAAKIAVDIKTVASVTAAALRAQLAPKFARFCLPEALVFVESIPKTSTGRMMKATLREQYNRQ